MAYLSNQLPTALRVAFTATRASRTGKLLAGVLLAGLVLTGCEKEEECDGNCIEVSGRIGSERNSTVPLTGAIVQLSSADDGFFFSQPDIAVQKVRSVHGYYSIKFRPTEEMKKRDSYRLKILKDGYGGEANGKVFTRAIEHSVFLKPGSRNEINFHLPRYGGYVRVLITGFTPGTPANNTFINVQSGRGQKGYVSSPSTPQLYATGTGNVVDGDNDTDVTCATAVNEYAYISISKTKNGVKTVVNDSIYCTLNTTVTYTHAF